ncbi:SDR family oxidoreductase [Ruminococcus sp. CLA-AA-H200]|uniref:SDR family oxidoreductase n=1 Tax=Ruminococcus turbiniformis TaxID=2881258 RepID=A0ABS8FT67_9FIRM|nr:SDR family oxidoreductase [Ruminococcus turbiniformis]MCC2253200.1 SDR family oxidoreductase [Ruminococcus turbiniformis]
MADIIVTGAGRGIGYFMTEQFLEDGNRVAVLDTETDGLEKLARRFPGRLVFYRTDVREEKQIQSAVDAAVETFGKVDAAVHNACCCPFVWEKDAALSVYEKAFDVNYYGALRLAKCVLPHMRARKGGRVIFTSSGVGVTGFAGISAYASTKVHPPLTRTQSSVSLPVPEEFMADPEKVGRGLAKNAFSGRFVICHSMVQKLQMSVCYLFPVKMGKLMTKMTMRCIDAK